MRMRRFALVTAGVLVCGVLGCVERQPSSPAPQADPSPKPETTDNPFDERLLQIAHTYRSFGQADLAMRWALADCRAPLPPELSVSASKDKDTHGGKLYAVFAFFKDDGSYVKAGKANPVNQEIVKESWVPEEIKDDGKPLEPAVRKYEKVNLAYCADDPKPTVVEERYLPYARKDGILYHAAKQGDLFIMYKTDPQTPGTDQGWVYGTVTADGKKVTSAGRVASCMGCHQTAPHDRLFGLPLH
jgi:hypothetical protein